MNFAQSLKHARQENLKKYDQVSKRKPAFAQSNLGQSDSKTRVEFDDTAVDTDDSSGIRLVSRYLSRSEVADAFEACELMSLTRVFQEVHPPRFESPPYSNFIVLGVVARRSEVRESSSGRGKYVMLWLSDLKYDITLAVHGKSFEKYYKIRPGTLVGILNPRFYTQRNGALTLCMSISRDNCVVEIGQAKDLGQCEGSSAQGTSKESRCRNWVDTRKTFFCEYHQQQRASRAASKRPEMNSIPTRLWEPRSGNRAMTVVRGGAVKWKNGLQVDYQAPLETKSTHFEQDPYAATGRVGNAPIGRIFQSGGSRRSFLGDVEGRFEKPFTKKDNTTQKNKRVAAELKEEVLMRKRLAALPDGYMLRVNNAERNQAGGSPPNASHTDNQSFSTSMIRRIGFNPALIGPKGVYDQPKAALKASSGWTPETSQYQDSDSDLEVEPPPK